ncbi:MAG: hypothetical protein OEM82_02735 [Acidobacteriota bacterium]|nr:hypothetical protein [Acidobacteriota bacterium]
MAFTLYDIVGSAGVTLIIAAYFLLQTKKIKTGNPMYFLINGIGAALILLSLCFDFNFPAFIVEFFWLLISLYGIGKYFISRETREITRKRNY